MRPLSLTPHGCARGAQAGGTRIQAHRLQWVHDAVVDRGYQERRATRIEWDRD
jgi:hypothetical protein